MPKKKKLDIQRLVAEAARFAAVESTHAEPSLYGITDGKAVGTYLEHKFTLYLAGKYDYQHGNSAIGVDFPALGVDIVGIRKCKQCMGNCPLALLIRRQITRLGKSQRALAQVIPDAFQIGVL